MPSSFSALELGRADFGGGVDAGVHHHPHAGALPLIAFRGPEGPASVRFRLVAQHAEIMLPSGRRISALTFNGTVPGPTLRVHAGELVQVTLVNRDVSEGVSIHWHGVDLPNAEDGVSGVTQNRVPPRASYTYRFRADVAGTYWYHSHQHSAGEVERGLYGALIVAPRHSAETTDVVAIAHTIDGVPILNSSDGEVQRRVEPGTPVRVRLVNSADVLRRFAVTGTRFRVVAIDARDKNGGAELKDRTLALPAGGRYDVAFRMPQTPVRVAVDGQSVGMVLLSGAGAVPAARFGPEFEADAYGAPAAAVPARFDRRFDVKIGRRFGFFTGGMRFERQWTINGRMYPHMPMYMVEPGETLEFRFSNDSGQIHPMHLHGHHMLVFMHNGRRVIPWWVDTLDVLPGERYDVAVFAANRGIWMFHCHNLPHAAHGLVTHVAYREVTTPFRLGRATGNEPE